MIRRIMQVEIEEQPDLGDGVAIIVIRDPRTGVALFSFLDLLETWVPND